MFGNRELANLIELAGVYRLRNGWQVIVRAEWTDVTPQRPHGLTYALILQDEVGNRLLGFDNSHAYDNAGEEEPYDHEHPAGRADRRIKYEFVSASVLITDAFERMGAYCVSHSVAFEFIGDGP